MSTVKPKLGIVITKEGIMELFMVAFVAMLIKIAVIMADELL